MMFEGPEDNDLNKSKSNSIDDAVNQMKGWGQKLSDAFTSNFNPEEILKAAIEMDNIGVQIAKSFGQGREQMAVIKGSLTDAYQSVAKLGGGMDDIATIQQGITSSLGRNIILQTEQFDKLYAATQVTGKGAGELISAFKNAGFSANMAAGEIEKVVNAARATGVSAQAVTDKVLSNMDALNKYNFQGGVEGLAKMAAHATALRIDMNNTLNFAEKVFNPEGAIEVAAAMQRLGVAQSDLLDPLRLMDLSQNDPAELQRQMADMASQFVQLNEKGQFEIMPGAKRQLREIESAMGLTQGSLAKMALSSAELGDKLSKIKFPDFATEEQKELIANLSEMNDKGEYIIKTEMGDMKLDEAMAKYGTDETKLNELIKAATPKTLEEIQKEQLTYSKSMAADLNTIAGGKYGIAGSKTMDQLLEAPRKIQTGIAETLTPDALSPEQMRKFFDNNTQPIFESINKMIKGEGSMEDVFKQFGTSVTNTKTLMSTGLDQALVKATEQFDKLSTSSNSFLNIMTSTATAVGGKIGGTSPKDVGTNSGTAMTNKKEEPLTYKSEDKKTYDVNMNLNFSASGQGFDVSKLTNDPKAMQDLTIAVKDAITSSGIFNADGQTLKPNINVQVR
jgi:hypothetical protein